MEKKKRAGTKAFKSGEQTEKSQEGTAVSIMRKKESGKL